MTRDVWDNIYIIDKKNGDCHSFFVWYNKPHKTKETNSRSSLALSDSNRIQTYNLLIRSQMLYSVELWSRCFSQLRCKGIAFFWNCKMSANFFCIFLHFFSFLPILPLKMACFCYFVGVFLMFLGLLLDETIIEHIPAKRDTCTYFSRIWTFVIEVCADDKRWEAAYDR